MGVAYQSLDILQEHGIAANDIQKLNNSGTLRAARWIVVSTKDSNSFASFLLLLLR
jgi:hypothetical protein